MPRPRFTVSCVLPSILSLLLVSLLTRTAHTADLDYRVSWLGNSFSGADGKWVQNFFIHMKVQPDGTVNTWSHWDEGGKKFGVTRTASHWQHERPPQQP